MLIPWCVKLPGFLFLVDMRPVDVQRGSNASNGAVVVDDAGLTLVPWVDSDSRKRA